MLARLAALVVPPLCAICSAPCRPAERVCVGCERKLAASGPIGFVLPGPVPVRSAARYEGTARALIARLKFAGRIALADVAGRLMAAAADPVPGTLLVPVPPAPARSRTRGFDPARLLCDAVAAHAGLDRAAALARDDGPRQMGRSRRERLDAAPAIRFAGPPVARRPICLVDDVVTTGGTLMAAAAALRSAASGPVSALTFARAE